jgi:hypothetical protein
MLSMLRLTVLALMTGGTIAGPLPALVHAADGEAIREGLRARYQLSRMEVRNPALEGHVLKRGSVLVLQADGAPAKTLCFVQLNTKSPRFHVRDYAEVAVAQDGTLVGRQGDFTLPKGTRLSVLDLKVDRDEIHVFTHTLEPVQLGDGKTAYGCTEFVFRVHADVRNRGDVAAVFSEIDRVLRPASNG